MRTCHRHYPGRFDKAGSLVYLRRQRPSLCNSQVGFCNYFFGACSAFTRVLACTLAESPSDPLHRKLRQLRCLRCRFDCYRVERTSSRTGVAPAEVQHLSRRTVTTVINSLGFHGPIWRCYIVAIALLSTRLSYEGNRANVPEKKRVRREPHPDWNLRCRQLIVWAAVYFLFISSSVQSSFLKFDHQ